MIIFAESSAGAHTAANQDSLTAELLHDQRLGRMAFAVVADGMGGMQCGEIASAAVVDAFRAWVERADFRRLDASWLWSQWAAVISGVHEELRVFSGPRHIQTGTTVTALLLTSDTYYVANVGDSRCYEVTSRLRLLTEDHSLAASQVRQGLLSAEQARTDPRQRVLLQCVGVGQAPRPDYFTAAAPKGAKYLLCTDGMRNAVRDEELFEVLSAGLASTEQLTELIRRNRSRGETDDISAILIEHCPQGGTGKIGTTSLGVRGRLVPTTTVDVDVVEADDVGQVGAIK